MIAQLLHLEAFKYHNGSKTQYLVNIFQNIQEIIQIIIIQTLQMTKLRQIPYN